MTDALLHSLCRNHALVYGNKRLAWIARQVFLGLNGGWVEASEDLMIAVAPAQADIYEWTDPRRVRSGRRSPVRGRSLCDGYPSSIATPSRHALTTSSTRLSTCARADSR